MNPARRRGMDFIARVRPMRQANRRFHPGLSHRVRSSLRLLPIPLAIAAALPALAADRKPDNWGLCPVQDAIPAFTGAQPPAADPAKARAERAGLPTVIEGDSQSGTDQTLEYNGNVTLQQGDKYLHADNLEYNQGDSTYIATGSVQYQDSAMRVVAERLHGNQETESHQLENVKYQLVSRRGNGGAERIEMGGAEGRLTGATYSTCDPEDRHWELRARRIDVDTDEGWGVAHGASIRMGKVPVLYMPWIKFPIDDRRHTGLLYPSISHSGRNGFDWRQPIYLNLAPNYDATLTPRWMSNRGVQLGAQFRYLYPGGKGRLEGTWIPHDDLVERRIDDAALPVGDPNRYDPRNDPLRTDNRGMLRFSGSHNIDSHWQARANLAWISDPRYLEDSGNSLYGVSAARLNSTVGLYGLGHYWSAGVMANSWQSADYTLNEANLPYRRQPRLYFDWEQPFGHWFAAGLHSEAVRFQHDERDGGSRLDLKPYVSMPLQGAAWYITPTMAWRYTGYQLDGGLANSIARSRAATELGIAGSAVTPEQLAPYRDARPTRSLPIGSLDAGLYFDRDTEIKGQHYLHTLEPRLFYLNAPYREQDGLPVFDTRAFTFSWGQLFRDNRYTGPDRQTDANQLTLALSSRLLRQADGHERLAVSLGQIRYFEDSQVTLSTREAPIEQGKSAWVADISYAPTDRWTIGTSYQWNPKYRRDDLASARARYLFPDDGVINLTYRHRRNPSTGNYQLKQADFSFLYPISPNWSVVGRYYYSLLNTATEDPKLLEALAGVQWDSCCLAVRVLARRYVRNREGELNNSIGVEFVLKGLGSAGRDTERVLRRAILGYYRDDLYLVPPSNTTPDPDDDDSDPDMLP
ncbi:LPS-assembly protein LptD [Pseudoxanthomonas sangjuensis]|nr:LPS-assembly protein LptD [Pseudoxanthomonas sangjuensis]